MILHEISQKKMLKPMIKVSNANFRSGYGTGTTGKNGEKSRRTPSQRGIHKLQMRETQKERLD